MAWVRTSTLLDFSPSMVAKGYDKVPCLVRLKLMCRCLHFCYKFVLTLGFFLF